MKEQKFIESYPRDRRRKPTSLFSDYQMNIPNTYPTWMKCRSRRTMIEILKIPQRISMQKITPFYENEVENWIYAVQKLKNEDISKNHSVEKYEDCSQCWKTNIIFQHVKSTSLNQKVWNMPYICTSTWIEQFHC